MIVMASLDSWNVTTITRYQTNFKAMKLKQLDGFKDARNHKLSIHTWKRREIWSNYVVSTGQVTPKEL